MLKNPEKFDYVFPFADIVATLDTKYQDCLIECFCNVPDYFWEIPASLSGKYHPKYDSGEGGLVRHVRGTILVAKHLFRMEIFRFTPRKRQLITMSLLLHDSFKTGLTYQKGTIPQHPNLAAKNFWRHSHNLSLYERLFVYYGILCHEGHWNKTWEGETIRPKPFTKAQMFIHICDMVASRRGIEIAEDPSIIFD